MGFFKCVLLKCKGVGFLQVYFILKCMGSGILTSVFYFKVYGEWDSYKCILLKCNQKHILP